MAASATELTDDDILRIMTTPYAGTVEDDTARYRAMCLCGDRLEAARDVFRDLGLQSSQDIVLFRYYNANQATRMNNPSWIDQIVMWTYNADAPSIETYADPSCIDHLLAVCAVPEIRQYFESDEMLDRLSAPDYLPTDEDVIRFMTSEIAAEHPRHYDENENYPTMRITAENLTPHVLDALAVILDPNEVVRVTEIAYVYDPYSPGMRVEHMYPAVSERPLYDNVADPDYTFLLASCFFPPERELFAETGKPEIHERLQELLAIASDITSQYDWQHAINRQYHLAMTAAYQYRYGSLYGYTDSEWQRLDRGELKLSDMFTPHFYAVLEIAGFPNGELTEREINYYIKTGRLL